MKKFFPKFSNLVVLALAMFSVQLGTSQTTVTIDYVQGTFTFEDTWQFVDLTTGTEIACTQQGDPTSSNTYTITDGNQFELRGYETFGDGWNNTDITLTLNLPGGGSTVLYDWAETGSPTTGPDGNGTAPCGTIEDANGFVFFQGIIALPTCSVECPDDIEVANDPGECGALVTVPSPVISEECTDMVLTASCTTFSGESELIFDGQTGNGVNFLTGGFVEITGVPATLPGPLADIDVEVCASGDFGGNLFERTSVFDENQNLVGFIGDELAGDCETYCFTYTVTAAEYAVLASDGVIAYEMLGNFEVNDICASNTFEASLCVPSVVDVALFFNDFNNTDDASGFYPVGTTTVTFFSQDVTGTVSSCSVDVTVIDTEAPVIECPEDVTLNLAAGECDIVYNFNVVATENCPPSAVDVAGPYCAPCEDPSGGSALACAPFASNSIIQFIPDVQDGFIEYVTYNQETFGNTPLATFNIYGVQAGNAVPYTFGGFTPLGSQTYQTSNADNGSCVQVNFDQPVVVPDGGVWVEIFTPGNTLNSRIVNTPATCDGNNGTGLLTYINAPACGLTPPMTFNSVGFNLDAGIVVGNAGGEIEGDPSPDNEFANGDALPIGTHLFNFTAEDGAGNSSECSFSVTVNEFPEALQTDILSCNGSINISVDEACTVVLNADQFLEGGMYGCYESDYQINIWPFNDQSAALNDVGGIDIDFNGLLDAQHTYEIVDLDTGNKCWGNFVVEDKIAPTIACEDLTLQCTDPTEVGAIIPGGLNIYADEDVFDISTAAGATYETEFNAIGGAVTDLSLELDITHTWIGDLDIDLISPAGTTVRVFDGLCATTDDIVATFEDGAPGFNCAASAAGNTYAPDEAFSAFNGEAAAGTWVLRITDTAFGDGGSLNSYSANITDAGVVVGGAVASDNCDGSDVVLVSETVEEGDCTDEFASVITRVWVAVDGSGNESEACTQTINVLRETLATLELPLNYDGLAGNNPTIECDEVVTIGVDANGYGILDPAAYGSPSGVGACGTIISYYTDVVLPICTETCADNKSTYKVVRKWTILDWCTGEILEPTQILKVMDTTAPVLSELADITVGTDIWGCGATIPLPVAAATDNCSETITYEWSSTAGTYNAQNNTFVLADPAKTMIGAPVVVTATATDCCGNSSTTSFNVTVEDQVPPVVVAETTRTVSLTTDGTAKIFAESFDDGSHDGCGPIGFEVRRMDQGSPCRPVPYATNSAEDVDNKTFSDKVFFCCADTEPVMVEFRVCDDADMNGIIGSSNDNCNTAMVEVIVQDKLAPQLIVPENTTVSCIDLAGIDLTDTDLLDELFGAATGAGTCNVTITQSAVGGSSCLAGTVAGTIFRNFSATNSAGTTNGQQQIAVTAGPDNVLTCNRIGLDTDNAVFSSLSSCAKERFENGPTEFACNGTQQRWWCAVNDGQNNNTDDIPALSIDCSEGFAVPEVIIDINGLCTEAGINIEVDTFQFAGGACQKYLVHYEVIDQCIFDDNYVDPITGQIDPFNSGNGYFELYLEIDAFDNDAPVLDCADVSVAATSCTGIDAEITVNATDACTDAGFFGYQWRLDVNNDDTIDFPASGWYSTDAATPGQVGLSEFPIGTHRFFWIVSDGCGNSETCSQLVTVTENEKEPTPYCFDGLSVAVMPSTGTVALWANDFDAGSFDNCAGDLLLTMVPEQDVIDLSADEAYAMSTGSDAVQQPNGDWGWEFDCSYIENGISAVIEVRIYVTDVNGNWDYCTASLRIDDNFDACEDSAGTVTYSVTGKLQTEQGEDVADADVTVDANFPEFPMTETVTGTYAFDLIENIDYSIVPAKNDNHLNGVTTLDIVMIQKHILGLDLLDSPYQLIAADVNNDCNVTGSDLVQVRKLILGKYPNEQFPSNDSWRFVEADYNFTNPEAPCNFSEVAEIFNLTAEEINDFVAIKVADVNATAQANAAMTADVRSTENLEFVVVDQTMAAGSNRIEVLAKDFNEVYGFQYTMNFNNVEFVSVEAGALNVTDNNFGLNANGNLLVSFDDANGVSIADDAVLFTIVLNASNNTLVSNAISMNSNGVAAEAYIGRNLEVLGSDVVFRTNEGEVAANAFSLFQNEPNPFNGATVVGFELPATAEATLSVYDVTGKVLYTKVDTYTKGYNTVTLNRDELTATGVLYYKLESGNNVATMKMIIID